jgi:hypothetical protein
MRFIIPPNSTYSPRAFELLSAWYVACGLTLADVDGTRPMYIDSEDGILLSTVYGVAKAPIVVTMPDLVALELERKGWKTQAPMPSPMELAEAKLAEQRPLEPEIEPVTEPHSFGPSDGDPELCGWCGELEDALIHSTPVDDLKEWVEQLATARAEEKAAKERAEEARDQILSRMINEGYKVGTINGRPAVQWVPVTSNRFQTAKFKAAHPEMAAEFTEPSVSNRLEVL